jgi:cytochrome c5
MGDGDLHSNKKEIQYTQCKTCHGTPTELPLTQALTDPNDIAFRLAGLNPVVELKPGDTILVTGQGEPLWNTRLLADGTYEMVAKATGQSFVFRAVKGSACTQNGQDQSSAYCHTCHAVQR